MRAHLELLELLMDTDNFMASLSETTEVHVREIAKAMKGDAAVSALGFHSEPDHEWIAELTERNDTNALTFLYANALKQELAEVLDPIRILTELNDGRISHAEFNRRYEMLVFGEEQ